MKAQFARGAVAIVGRRIDDDREPVRTVAFVADLLDLFFARSPPARAIARLMLSSGMLFSRAFSTAIFRRWLASGSGDPDFAESVISRLSLVKSAPRCASLLPLSSLIFCHLRAHDMTLFSGSLRYPGRRSRWGIHMRTCHASTRSGRCEHRIEKDERSRDDARRRDGDAPEPAADCACGCLHKCSQSCCSTIALHRQINGIST